MKQLLYKVTLLMTQNLLYLIIDKKKRFDWWLGGGGLLYLEDWGTDQRMGEGGHDH